MSITKHHAEWLSLIEVSGPFLSLPVLKKMFPQGLEAHDADHARVLRQVHEEWDDNQRGLNPDPAIHTQWIRWVLRNTLELEDVLVEGQAIPQTIKAEIEEPQHRETLRPDLVLMGPENKPRLLIQTYPLTQKLGRTVDGKPWKASPDTRMTQLLRDTGVQIGLVTNGDQWMLVYAPPSETSGYASWYASLWLEESKTLAAFRTLLGVHRFFGVPDDQTLVPMLAESASHQQEVTDQLGSQVRSAVEILIQSLDRADQDYGKKLLGDVPNETLYESALTVMMRLVFLFCAEERELLLLGDQLFDQHYAVSTLVAQLQETADQHGEEILERRFDAWCRLLSTFRAVYGGVNHDRMRLPAYAGNLFNPDRFPFLEGRKKDTKWRESPATPLPVNNRTVLHLLRSLQYLELHGEAQRLSFRALDIEQIGHVYEGLLDHTAKRADEPFLGLVGKKEPEVALSTLEELRAKGDADLFDFLKKETGSTRKWANSLDKELAGDPALRLRAACGNDDALYHRVLPFAGLVRNDSFDRPVVVRSGSVYVTAGTDRRSSGTHYTPRSLTEPIVQYTLEPLVYEGPAEGWDKEKWQLRSPKELLDLKICDMACGSGAFLVQACRYMSERLQEAWASLEKDGSGGVKITPFGEPSTGDPDEQLIPDDSHERAVYARRVVAQRCLYGVDINPLAVEMAKLSLWLLTLAKDKPFTFLDHSIRCGDSLVGISSIEQLLKFSLASGEATGPLLEKQRQQIENRVAATASLRRNLETIPSNSPADLSRKEDMLSVADEQTSRLAYIANALVAASWGNRPELGGRLKASLIKVADDIRSQDYDENWFDKSSLEHLRDVGIQRTFHWPLEFPEVFDAGGFDAFVCNPPFMGNKYWGSRISPDFKYWASTLLQAKVGRLDLAVLFFRRAQSLAINPNGSCGFIATRAVHEGECVRLGLGEICSTGNIFRAETQIPWPGTAGVHVSLIWYSTSKWTSSGTLNGVRTKTIGPTLSTESVEIKPLKLCSSPESFQGSHNGRGETLTLTEADAWFSRLKSAGSPFLRPFVTSDDITSRGTNCVTRWIVDCEDLSLDDIEEQCSDTHAFLIDVVKPVRNESYLSSYKGLAERWWQLWNHRAPLYRKLRDFSETCVVVPFVAKHVFAAEVPSSWVFTNKLCVILCPDEFKQCSLMSNFFEAWVRQFSGTRGKTRITLSLSDAVQTYPLAPGDRSSAMSVLRRWNELFSQLESELSPAYTRIWNAFHDPAESSDLVKRLRVCRSDIDRLVAASFGLDDVGLEYGFVDREEGIRYCFTDPTRSLIMYQLLSKNQERYTEEADQGLNDKKKSSARKRNANVAKPTAGLFEHAGIPASFPSNKRDNILCGLLCGLVQARDDHPAVIYRNALVIVWQFERFKDLLPSEADGFAKACKKLPKTVRSSERIIWSDVVDHLSDRKAIVVGDDQTIRADEELDEVRASFPQYTKKMCSFALKASLVLREIQETHPDKRTEQERELFADFQALNQSLVGVGA